MTTGVSRGLGETKPRGKEEVREALLAAANRLFGESGPDRVSVRDVAQEAGVNHALLHRHFGSKETLLREVLSAHARAFRQAASEGDGAPLLVRMFETALQRPAFIRILAHLVLSGDDPQDWVLPEGGVLRLAERLAGEEELSAEQRLDAAILSSVTLGWLLFEPFLLFAAGVPGQEEDARTRLKVLLDRLSPPPPTPPLD